MNEMSGPWPHRVGFQTLQETEVLKIQRCKPNLRSGLPQKRMHRLSKHKDDQNSVYNNYITLQHPGVTKTANLLPTLVRTGFKTRNQRCSFLLTSESGKGNDWKKYEKWVHLAPEIFFCLSYTTKKCVYTFPESANAISF